MEAILVSSCLLGNPVRYDGAGKRCGHALLQGWIAEGRVVPFCPEVAGGLPTPRPPAEIRHGLGGAHVLAGRSAVVESGGKDVSAEFIDGARQALAMAQRKHIRVAILKEGSPSCGSTLIYDGSFSGQTLAGDGVTAALLRQAGIAVFSEAQLPEAAAYIAQLEASPQAHR
ncbi:DUF523 domain-containing protein [Pseudoduganella ginsengisoli]|uniref:DUF523 domain-containing protein n=1 Tax=Pseudoduganella ginsengisoli TaxID=1462440 RepID=A0A6L6Q1I6_9BURK|nr:DUF523 domain-containing protein [Pseudoduganella ginsengisoli]MTW03703.1 DUF523 domain-containing protein [Pseudoduganella ginsengisoli]